MNDHRENGVSEKTSVNSGPYNKTPPQIPVAGNNSTRAEEKGNSDPFGEFGTHFHSLQKKRSIFRVVEVLLKRPACITYEITKGNLTGMAFILLAITCLSMFGYGLMMGGFSGGHQLWVVPIKAVVGILLSGLICLPSLYIFMCLSGGEQSFSEAAGLLLSSLSLTGILLAGFAPITWIFSQSTNSTTFMGGLHLAFLFISMCFGLRILEAAFAFLNRRRMKGLKTWSIIFALVVIQMCTTLRPLVGAFKGFQLQGKKCFLMQLTS